MLGLWLDSMLFRVFSNLRTNMATYFKKLPSNLGVVIPWNLILLRASWMLATITFPAEICVRAYPFEPLVHTGLCQNMFAVKLIVKKSFLMYSHIVPQRWLSFISHEEKNRSRCLPAIRLGLPSPIFWSFSHHLFLVAHPVSSLGMSPLNPVEYLE